MTLFTGQLASCRRVKAAHLGRHLRRRIRLAGWLITGKKVHTKTGEAMEFLTFEDESGLVETTFFPKTYARYCHLIDGGRPYLLTGVVEQDYGAVTLTVDHLEPLGR